MRKQKHPHEMPHCVVKRAGGICQKYDERKVYGSAYAACYVVLMNENECERIASSVSKNITKLVRLKKSVDSEVIAREVTARLKKHNSHAAFMYSTHRDLS